MAQRETPRLPSPAATAEYLIDAWQRSVLFLDVMRRRAVEYEAHRAEVAPNVLDYKAELVLDGRQAGAAGQLPARPHPAARGRRRSTRGSGRS